MAETMRVETIETERRNDGGKHRTGETRGPAPEDTHGLHGAACGSI